MQQLPGVGVVHAIVRDQPHPRVDPLLDLLAPEVRHHRLDAEIAHVDRILQDEGVDVRVGEPFASVSDASKPTNFTFPAQPLSSSTRSIASDVDSFGQKMPSTSRLPSGRL